MHILGNHVEGAETEHAGLAKEVESFVIKHLLHWFEALSWVGKLGLAPRALRVVLNFMVT
jgi:hypothetical protein